MSESLIKDPAAAAEQVPALEQLVSAAYKSIDTAIVKGIIHANTGARRKARVASYKRQVRFLWAARMIFGLMSAAGRLAGRLTASRGLRECRNFGNLV